MLTFPVAITTLTPLDITSLKAFAVASLIRLLLLSSVPCIWNTHYKALKANKNKLSHCKESHKKYSPSTSQKIWLYFGL